MYTIDNEGKLNNYAIEPAVYPAAYPTIDEQHGMPLKVRSLLCLWFPLCSSALL